MVSNNWCKTDGLLSRHPSLLQSGKCFDVSRYWSPPEDILDDIRAANNGTIETCPLGSQKDECGEQPVYVQPAAPGGCHQTCDTSILSEFVHPDDGAFDPRTTCSDGGQGSVRIRFQMPVQKAPNPTDADFTGTSNRRYHYQELLRDTSTDNQFRISRTTDDYAWDHNSENEDIRRQGLGKDEYDKITAVTQYEYWDFACETAISN